MLNSIDFNKLKTFYYIYRNNSIIDAAKELNVTPSAISQQLKKLESEIDVHLFTRMHKRLVPTAEAKTLFHILHPFITDLESGLKLFRHGKNEPSGMLRIGAPAEFGKAHFPRIIGAFRKQYAAVNFSLTLGNSEKLLEMIKNGDLDFALVDLFLSQREYISDLGIYHVESIVDEEVILACSSTYYEKNIKGDFSPDNILSQDFISYDHSILALSGWFRHHFDLKAMMLNTVLTVDSVQAVFSAIQNDIGLGVITTNTIRSQILEGTIIPVKTGEQEIINKISLVQLQDKIPSFAEKKFQSHLRETLEKHSY